MRLGEAVSQRICDLRKDAGLTRDALARACAAAGFSGWNGARVAQVELGSANPTLTTLAAIAAGLSRATGDQYRLADLVPPAVTVEVPEGGTMSTDVFRAAMRDEPVTQAHAVSPISSGFHGAPPDVTLTPGWGLADDRAADALEAAHGAGPAAVRTIAEQLWGAGATVTTERDRRAGPDATPQKRGRITRRLVEEVLAEYEESSGRAAHAAD